MPKYESTNVETLKLFPVVKELIDRCGSPEQAALYAGVAISTMYRLYYREHRTTQARTARVIILALFERRKEDRRNGASERFRRARKYQAVFEDRLDRMEGY